LSGTLIGSISYTICNNYLTVKRQEHNKLIKLVQQLVRETIYAGSQPDESYSTKLIDDPAFNDDSVYVPDSVKLTLKQWLKSMKLD